MPDLLLELFSEEIPARMQARAGEDLRKAVTDGLVTAGLAYEGAKAFATPRRLTLAVTGIPAASAATREEKKGPRVGAPDQAVQGFLKSAGLSSLAEAQIVSDPKKGDFYVAVIERAGRPALSILADLLPQVIRGFSWPKSMRWGAASAEPGSLRWVRPLQSILATFGPETEDPEIVPFSVDGIAAGNVTYGHRFHAPDAIEVRRFEDYVQKLERAKVVLDPARRMDIIRHDARALAFAQGLEIVEDEALLAEVAGLVEWPVVLMGSFEERFLDIPDEVVRATIRANQKCFVLRDPATGRLTNRFLLTANLEAKDGGRAIVAGNERVVRARLSDALYFWQTDRAPLPDAHSPAYVEAAKPLGLDLSKPLDQRMAKLAALNVVFHEKLGTQGERVQRIAALAREIAPKVGADPELAHRAAVLAKADLTSEVVGEFPEVQGLMGGRYAAMQGEHPSVCTAIEEHYKPQGPSDRVPSDPVAIAVALADKLDTLVGFWAIDEKPTGSKDPYALRRAALGVIRLITDNHIQAGLGDIFADATLNHRVAREHARAAAAGHPSSEHSIRAHASALYQDDLLAFFHDRLKVMLRDQGARHDLVDAVLGEGGTNDDLLVIVRKVEALGRFLSTPDGAALLAGFRRAANILKAEEKKDARAYAGHVDAGLIEARGAPEERELAHVVAAATGHADTHLLSGDYEGAMTALAALRPAVDAFFEKILVNDPDPALRANRLELLAKFRAATARVADFARIEG